MRKISDLHNWSAGLAPELQAEIRRLTKRRKLRDGQKLYDVGETASETFRIESGRIRITNCTMDGDELVVGELFPGDWVGTVGVVDGLPRANVAQACGDTEVAVLSRADFRTLFSAHPEVAEKVCVMVCGMFRMAETLAEDAFLLDIPQRLARMLVRLAHAGGTSFPGGSVIIEGITQEDLANRLGATRQSVSRELKKLQAQGHIQVKYGKILVRDLEQLTRQVDQLIGVEQIGPVYQRLGKDG